MKLRAADLEEEDVYRLVSEMVERISGTKPEKIRPDARIAEDIGLYGDDGYDLIQELDEKFEMDWGGLRLGVHFGSEGFGPPQPPWRVRGSDFWYRREPLTIERLVRELRTGCWSGTALVPLDRGARRELLLASWAVFLLIAGGLGVVLLPTILRAVTN